jgi:polyisoprenyl-phosphate glycosyltransferase
MNNGAACERFEQRGIVTANIGAQVEAHLRTASASSNPVPIALSVAVPCFNEAENLPELYRRLIGACGSAGVDRVEFVFVNDGSTDRTWDAINDLAMRDPRIVGIDLSRNFGHQLALSAALSFCRGERIFILDADLQDPPELLVAMMRRMDEGADVVYGKRRSRAGDPGHRLLAAKLFYRALRPLVDFDFPLDTGDFRLISRRVLEVVQAMPETHRFIRGMVSWVGFRQVAIEYDREPRFAGKTGYSIAKLVGMALDGVTSFSIRPLRVGIYCGLGLAVLSLLLIVGSILSWAFLSPPPGWTSLVTVILLLGGVQTAMLGLIGEYVSRNFIQSKGRPLFVVRDVLRVETPSAVRHAAIGSD